MVLVYSAPKLNSSCRPVADEAPRRTREKTSGTQGKPLYEAEKGFILSHLTWKSFFYQKN